MTRGEWEECVYVGGLFVHVAKKEGLMGVAKTIVYIDPEVSVSDGPGGRRHQCGITNSTSVEYPTAKYNKEPIRDWVSH